MLLRRDGHTNQSNQLWDTAGQERFRSVTRSYYRGAAGAILVYDVTSRASFTNLSRWLADCKALASPHLAIVLVGNKLDREDDREVETAEGERFAQDNGECARGERRREAAEASRNLPHRPTQPPLTPQACSSSRHPP